MDLRDLLAVSVEAAVLGGKQVKSVWFVSPLKNQLKSFYPNIKCPESMIM